MSTGKQTKGARGRGEIGSTQEGKLDGGRKMDAGAEKQEKATGGSTCPKCKEQCEDGQDAMNCEICEEWWHTQCIGMLPSQYKAMEAKGVHWFCDKCDEKFGEVLKDFVMLKSKQEEFGRELQGVKQMQEKFKNEVVIMKEKQDKMEKDTRDLDKKVGQLEEVLGQRITDIEEILKQKAEATEVDNIKKSYSEAAQTKQLNSLNTDEVIEQFKQKIESEQAEAQKLIDEGVKEVLQDFKKNMDEDREEARKMLEETKERIQNEKDRESRKNNIVIYRVEENASTSAEDRTKYDKEWVKELTREVLKVHCGDEDIKRVIRLGAKGSVDRPMLVEYRSHIIKNQVMESLGMLKDADDRFRNISVTYDMTKSDREQSKEMVKQAIEKRAADQSGEYRYLVKGIPGSMRVIKVRKL